MKRTNSTAIATALFAVILPGVSTASLSTDPIVTVGLLGSYSALEFKERKGTSTEYMPEGGLFVNFGNKMTNPNGLIYQAEISGQYAEKDSQKVKDGQADVDLGWRVAFDPINSIDVLFGAGYKWNRFNPASSKYDIDLTSRTPFAKVTTGFNHQFNTAVLRIEAGVRQVINGDSQLNVHGISNQTLDLQDTTNPFIELSLLFNRQGSLPAVVSLYYNHFNYDFDGQFVLAHLNRQTRDEYGAKIGLVF